MSNRKVTRQQFSDAHAIDGSRLQAATEDVYARFNNIPISDVNKRGSLQYLVAKVSGRTKQIYDPALSVLDGTNRPPAPFLDHAMKDTDDPATPALFRAKGVQEQQETHGFVWSVSTVFRQPVTIESVSVEVDSGTLTPFSLATYNVVFTAPHGLSVGDMVWTTARNAAGPVSVVWQRFRVVSVPSPDSVVVIWHSHQAPSTTPYPRTESDPITPLVWSTGPLALDTVSIDPITSAKCMSVLIDCPFMSYSTDHRLDAKIYSRSQFDERMLTQRKLNDAASVGADMYPGIKGPTDEMGMSYDKGLECLYFDDADLNIPIPGAQSVTFRAAFSSSDYAGMFPAAAPRANLVITYRERLNG